MADRVKEGWKSLKRRSQRTMGGVVGDPLPQRIELFLKREQLRLRRTWLKAAAGRKKGVPPPENPIFVIGCPRSGTTLLFRLLQKHPKVGTLDGEGHILWSTYQHPRDRGWSSDRLTGDDIRPGERDFLYAAIQRVAGERRFLDKTPRNCLRVPYLLELFPGATIVLLKRDGPPTVSSLIEGWTVRHGISYRLPEPLELAEYKGNLWSYLLPPDWRDLRYKTFADVAARQYVASYETALHDIRELGASVVEVSYEALIAEPVDEMGRLLRFLQLDDSRDVMAMAANLSRHQVQTNSPPRPDKWRERASEIRRIVPIIAPTMEELGYTSHPEL